MPFPSRGPTISTRHVWGAYGAVALAMLVTYSRVEPERLYNVSHEGIAGGLSRVLVFANFSVALVAVPLAILAAARLATVWAVVAAAVAVVLCAVVAAPGVVDQNDLDAKPVNAVPALGVALAIALELLAPPLRLPLDRLRVAAIAVLALVSLPWIAAELGFHAGFGVFLSGEPRVGGDGHVHAAVHLGHHHGLDGALLAASALVLWRAPRALALRAYVALMLAYGLVNAAQDGWTEQVVKRGWAAGRIPDALHPSLSVVWLVILVLAALFLVADRLRAPEGHAPAPAR